MALDIDSLPELELQHKEDTEQYRDQTPRGPEPIVNDPAEPDCAESPQNAPPQPPARERAPWTHVFNALRRHHPKQEASKGPTEYQASLES